MGSAEFHPAVSAWFGQQFDAPTDVPVATLAQKPDPGERTNRAGLHADQLDLVHRSLGPRHSGTAEREQDGQCERGHRVPDTKMS